MPMSWIRSKLLALVVVSLLALGGGAAAAGLASASGDNAAVAVNTTDNSSVFDFAFSIRQVSGDVVDQQNAAVAYSSCSSCQAVAVAIQIVLVMSDPSVVTPENVAIAINENCTACETMALAYQFVVSGQGMRFTHEGRRELARIRWELHRLAKSDLSLEEIRAAVSRIVERIRVVLTTQLVPVDSGNSEGDQSQSEGQQAPADQQTQTTPSDQTSTTTQPTDTSTTPATTTQPTTTPQP
ncbi:MAG: putative peptide zinc metalloprotease protein [Solirubrobacterales bacterium]|nr:putative peptide zinc metalloprotease protein [Solirubrobacterales bacterium]